MQPLSEDQKKWVVKYYSLLDEIISDLPRKFVSVLGEDAHGAAYVALCNAAIGYDASRCDSVRHYISTCVYREVEREYQKIQRRSGVVVCLEDVPDVAAESDDGPSHDDICEAWFDDPTDLETVRLLRRGLTREEMADELGVSRRFVNHRIHRIIKIVRSKTA